MTNRSGIEAETASRYFFYVTAVNILIAAFVTAPVLDPQLGIPIKINHWPGTWIFVAYFSFLIVGVLGMLAWAVMYYMLPRLFNKAVVNRSLLYAHLLVTEFSVVGATGLMGIFPGYVGGTLVQQGFGDIEVTRVVEWTVIPIGIFISLAVLATLAGLVNMIFLNEPAGVASLDRRSGPSSPRNPALALLLAAVPGLLGVMGLGHIYVGRLRRGAFLLVFGAALEASFIWLLTAVAPHFSGWAYPGFIAPGTAKIDGIGFSEVITLFLLLGILLAGLWVWQSYDSYSSAAETRLPVHSSLK
jgi:hypothetical protein